MKNTPLPPPSSPSRPRLVCRVVRLWCSLTDSTHPDHATACAECRAYFQAGAALDGALRREAAQTARALPESAANDLERGILRAVRNSARVPAPERTHHWRGALTTGAVAAAFAVAVVYFNRSAMPSAPGGAADRASAAEAAVIVDAVQEFSSQLVGTVIPSAGAMVANNPLQQEFDSIYADARSALGFLALNFLPVLPEAGAGPAPVKRTI